MGSSGRDKNRPVSTSWRSAFAVCQVRRMSSAQGGFSLARRLAGETADYTSLIRPTPSRPSAPPHITRDTLSNPGRSAFAASIA